MISDQENFQSFIRLIESPSDESLNEAIQKINDFPQIAEIFAQQSPKFVEIFSHLQPGVTSPMESIKYYQIISAIFSVLIPKPKIFFRSLNYLADSLIRRHLHFLLELMMMNKSRISLHILVQIACVHPTHCRDLFSSFSMLAFSKPGFQKFIKKEGLEEYIKLATVFLTNNDVSPQFLSTKYSLSPIWKVLKKADFSIVKPFIISLTNAASKLNQSTKCWVFNEKTLESLSEFPLSHENDGSAQNCMFILLESLMEGKNSIIVENPQRTYCHEIANLDPLPCNVHILNFLRKLDVWTKPSHRELCLYIFKQSPDLISRFLVEQRREISPELNLSTVSTLFFIGKIIELDWPDFLYENENFFNEKRSLDFLFESILPSVLTNIAIDKFLKSKSVLLMSSIVKILLKSVLKFSKLPQYMKMQDLLIKFRGRIPNSLPQMLFKQPFSNGDTIFPYSLKLLILLDQVFPFYVSDSISKEPPFIKEFNKFSPQSQLLILRFISHIQNPLPQIKNLCALITDSSQANLPPQIMKEIFKTLYAIIKEADVFSGFKNEIPIFISESIRLNKGAELFELINEVKNNFLKYVGDGSISPVCNALNIFREKSKEKKTPVNPLYDCVKLISLMNNYNLNFDEINLSPAVIMSNLKWHSLEISAVLLCTSIAKNVTDLDLALNCLTIVVSCDPHRTIKYVLNHPFIQSSAFNGSPTLDSFIAQFIEWNKGCNDKISESFLSGYVKQEIIEKIAPFISEKFNRSLVKKMIKNKISIRPVVIETRSEVISQYQKVIDDFSPFWKWAFDGFEPINLSRISERALNSISKKNKDESLILDILRTIHVSKDTSLIEHILLTPETLFSEEEEISEIYDKLLVFAIDMLPSFRGKTIKNSLSACYLTDSKINDPLSVLERTDKEWSYEYLLNQIKDSEFDREATSEDLLGDLNPEARENKIKFIIRFYLSNQTETLLRTFEKVMFDYIIQNPQIVEKPLKIQSPFFDSISSEIVNPSNLIEYDESQFEGISNVLLGTTRNFKISVRVILYLATSLSTSPSFYQLIEHAGISPSTFLFATGEVAKVIIQQLDSNQKIYPSSLCRNSSYLAPFHVVHQGGSVFEVDTPFFRFLLHFACYLLSTSAVPLENYIESGAVSILFRALSSKSDHARNVAYASLSELYDLNMKKPDYNFHFQLQLLLEVLLNAVTTPGKRFTSLITHFLTLASSIIIKPNHTIFSTLIKFLGSDKTLRVGSVPLFNDLFGQSGLDFRNQRNWILKMLKNGVCETSDVELMKKSKIIERLCAFFASPLSEMKSRKLILEILINASKYDKLDGIMIWAYSLINEHFALPHIDQIVTLALSIRSKDPIEVECTHAIAELVWKNYRDSLDQSKEQVVKMLSK